MEEIKRRINQAKYFSRNGKECKGTALFITGERDVDEAMSSKQALEAVSNLSQISEPIEGCIISLELGEDPPFKRKIHHMGVVVQVDPLLITNREGSSSPVYERETLDLFLDDREDLYDEIRYYLPRRQVNRG